MTVGAHTLTASYGGDKNFGGSSAGKVFQVTPAASNITISPVADQTYGVGTVNVTTSSTAPGQMHFAISGPAGVKTYSQAGAQLIITGAGRVTFTVNQEAVTGYAAASSSISFNVNPATPTLVFRNASDRTYGAAPFALSTGSASTGAVTYKVLSGPVTLAGSVVTIKGAGTATIQATQAAAGNYAATEAVATFTINPATPQLSMQGLQPRAFGAAPFSPVSTSTSPGAITYSVVSGPAVVNNNVVTLTGAGVVTVRANQAATTDFVAASAQVSLTVTLGTPGLKMQPVTTAPTIGSVVPLVPLTASNAPITYTVLIGPARLSGNTVIPTGVGFIVVQAIQAANANFVAAGTKLTFNSVAATADLTFEPLSDQLMSAAPFSVQAFSRSSAPISYKVVSGPATINSNIVTVQGTGTVLLEASQGSNGLFPPATVTQAFLVIPPGVGVQ